MFESIEGHSSIKKYLCHAINNSRLPFVLGLEGSPFSGRLSFLLEIVRLMQCQKDREEDCACPACLRNKKLSDPTLIIYGERDDYGDISLSAEKAQSDHNFLPIFLRKTRILLKRFDVRIVSDKRYKQIASLITSIEEDLSSMSYNRKIISSIHDACRRLYAFQTPEMHAVREMHNLSHLHNSKRPLFIVWENIQRVSENCANALLMYLENSSPSHFFFSTLSSRHALKPSLASRMHFLHLHERSNEEICRVSLHEFGRESTNLPLLCLRSRFGVSIRHLVRVFLDDIFMQKRQFWSLYSTTQKNMDDPSFWGAFSAELAQEISERLPQVSSEQTLNLFSLWNKIEQGRIQIEQRKLSVLSVLEPLYYSQCLK